MIKRIRTYGLNWDFVHNREVEEAVSELEKKGMDVREIKVVQKQFPIFGLRDWIADIIYDNPQITL